MARIKDESKVLDALEMIQSIIRLMHDEPCVSGYVAGCILDIEKTLLEAVEQ